MKKFCKNCRHLVKKRIYGNIDAWYCGIDTYIDGQTGKKKLYHCHASNMTGECNRFKEVKK